jgi:hypothetical protein
VTQKAHKTLSFSNRNISHWPTNIKAQHYSTLVTNWSPVEAYSAERTFASARP